ncbi:MAG TPA: hypothetical protein QGH10_12285 [Armatimonadota bacterium]|nr:hypothetical protein [Armatimonadota bacterium]
MRSRAARQKGEMVIKHCAILLTVVSVLTLLVFAGCSKAPIGSRFVDDLSGSAVTVGVDARRIVNIVDHDTRLRIRANVKPPSTDGADADFTRFTGDSGEVEGPGIDGALMLVSVRRQESTNTVWIRADWIDRAGNLDGAEWTGVLEDGGIAATETPSET